MTAYRSQAEADSDKAHLVRLHAALNAAGNALRLDDCRVWTIRGRLGPDGIAHNLILTGGDGKTWLLCVARRSAQAWTWAKKRVAFCEVTQNGDEGGVLQLSRLPDAVEVAEIRDLVGIRQHSVMSPLTVLWRSVRQNRQRLPRLPRRLPQTG